ncbi:polysaccharide pyruvyl transferase family protein [Treponema denticola]|uniref:Polysaccharide pyruvyl transferase domain-containing protein n=1 Tax=Treponema denticola OTK TaxID=999434 RepID=A0A0F6MM28_TREDN|nr:polysaccharide pyruvyl transferase family protein [Treponema denticola]EMB19796.1 hypothetical protein HMPREF9723_02493 [Treponema denticola OTK]EMB21418.1 hypothetical protein HMPREF9724_02048 [Treponema denticola SP37]EPF32942.1 hypothetical protein HMPREF9734_02265 [Treponema denticola SP44]EPF40419.1 hypothetical protein HMPREF9731_00281 [Treponema denticola SP23]UTC95355.1 polysaccharide pyruvyl transferase family protein [Treponema denticola]
MKILYYNNCWFTNVGEAFIDVGAMKLIKNIFADSKIACISDMTDFYVHQNKNREKNFWGKNKFDISKFSVNTIYENFDADYIILAGMFASETYLLSPGREMVDFHVNKGAKLIFLGLGSDHYSDREYELFSAYLKKVNPTLVVTRDNKTYQIYKDCCNCVPGIDCAFWIREVFNPMGFGKRDYSIVSFNRLKEKPIITFDQDEKIICPWHMQFSYSDKVLENGILISDTPYDYLTAYANAKRVYTDLVHATIVSLMYETPVKYFYFDERSTAFEVFPELIVDKNGFMILPQNHLIEIKKEIESKIKNNV